MSRQVPRFVAGRVAKDVRVGIVAARFNAKVVDALLEGCLKKLRKLGVGGKRVEVERVPGAFEIPLVAKAMARTKKFGAVICLGAVIRGETPHFDLVAGECARGVAEVSREEMLPVIFGVLTTNNEEQAWDRCGGKHGHVGEQAAEAAVEMMGVMRRILGNDER
ncbi:MAG: 6,7-dimethyl-8-ribityllumazine synthase [Planctomycetota bacterium]|nr:6,7-dimethyl-8-ribityllumazine synthase [Planctomycetota bacterium]